MNHSQNKQLVRAGHEFAAAMSTDMPIIEIAKIVTRLASALDVQTVRANVLDAERKAATDAEIEWETAMRQATGADSVDDVVSVIQKLKSDLAEMAAENLTLKEATKNGAVEKHQQISNGICIGFKSVIVKREIDTPATDAWFRGRHL